METDIFCRATKLKKSINYYDSRLIQLERLLAYWKANNIKVNDHDIIFDEEHNVYRLKQMTTIINVVDNRANVNLTNLIIPVEVLEDLIKYYKDQKTQLEKEFEEL